MLAVSKGASLSYVSRFVYDRTPSLVLFSSSPFLFAGNLSFPLCHPLKSRRLFTFGNLVCLGARRTRECGRGHLCPPPSRADPSRRGQARVRRKAGDGNACTGGWELLCEAEVGRDRGSVQDGVIGSETRRAETRRFERSGRERRDALCRLGESRGG
jgi:hypothetical protein